MVGKFPPSRNLWIRFDTHVAPAESCGSGDLNEFRQTEKTEELIVILEK